MAASPPITKLTGTRAQQITEVYNLIMSRIGAQYGTTQARQYAESWKTYANAHPSTPVGQLYLAWFLNESNLPAALGQDIGAGITGAGNLAGNVGPVTADSTSPTALIGGIWGGLTSKNLWIRAGEFVVALILLDVGLKAFTGTSVTEKAVKATGPGKIAKAFK